MNELDLLNLLNNKFSIVIKKEQYDMIFFDPSIGLKARDMLILISEAEKTFGVHFSECELTNKDTYTFNGFLVAIENSMESRNNKNV